MNQEKPPAFDFEAGYRDYLRGLLSHDPKVCRTAFEGWLHSDADLRSLYEGLVQRSLYEVGDLWERGKVSVATEHMATAITESLLNLVYPRLFSRPRCGKSALVACVVDEQHQVGAKIVADFFELHGWRGYFLGANTPVAALKEGIAEMTPNVVALSASLVSNIDSLIGTSAAIRAEFPELPVLVGGQAFQAGGRERVENMPRVTFLDGLSELDVWLDGGKARV